MRSMLRGSSMVLFALSLALGTVAYMVTPADGATPTCALSYNGTGNYWYCPSNGYCPGSDTCEMLFSYGPNGDVVSFWCDCV
jgi:hypothetical protein